MKVQILVSMGSLAINSDLDGAVVPSRIGRTLRKFTQLKRVVIEGKVKGQIFGSTGVKQVKMAQFCWQWSQNVHLVNTMKNQNSLPYVRCFVTMVAQQKRSVHGH